MIKLNYQASMINLDMNISTTSIKFESWKMRSYHIFFMIVIEICYSEIDRDQDEYLMSTLNVECGKSPGFSTSSSSRIINGIPAAQAYPWIADVVNFASWDPTSQPSQDVRPSMCGGSLISDRVVLTAGHCVCIGILHPKDEEDLKKEGLIVPETCLKNTGNFDINQNRKYVNEIHVIVGERTIDTAELLSEQPQFDPSIHAYLYEYAKPDNYDDMFHTFSKNGDIALIVNDYKPFYKATRQPNIVPICLPSPDAFNENKFTVTTAARGSRYEASRLDDITGNRIPSSCTTNEGTKPTNENLSNRNFLPCKTSQKPTEEIYGGEYCSNFLQDNAVNSFSIHDDLELSSNEWKFKNGFSKSCNNYYRKAKEIYARHKVLENGVSIKTGRTEFDEKVERFEIQNKNDEGVLLETIETCYNVKALGQYGICQIDENNSPSGFQWGFCSRTCRTPDRKFGNYRSDEPYEVAMFDFMDIAPTSALFSSKYWMIRIDLNIKIEF